MTDAYNRPEQISERLLRCESLLRDLTQPKKSYFMPGDYTNHNELRRIEQLERSKKIINTDISNLTTANPLIVPFARVYNNANISINNNTTTALTFNSERWDTDNIHSTSTNTGRLTCKTAGVYNISASVQFESNATGTRAITILLGGTTVIGSDQRLAANVATTCNLSIDYVFAVNDYVEVQVYQNSGGALNVVATSERTPLFMMHYVGKAST